MTLQRAELSVTRLPEPASADAVAGRRITSQSGDRRQQRHFACALVVLCCGLSALRADDRTDFFESRIRPVLVKHCYECHSSASDEPQGKLQLDYRDGLLKGGDSGTAVVPGRPEDSLLISALKHETLEMPPSEKLKDEIVADFERWIRDGAIDPRNRPPSPADAAAEAWKSQLAERSRWWSLQAPESHVPPDCDDANWSNEPVDRFIQATLKKAGLSAAAPASPNVLLRRLSFVLTGLPPEPALVTSFPEAYERSPERALAQLVDQLLASPHFGERFARHWMDVVRYTDTYGYEWDIAAKGSWEYRDYLIRAFNEDIGFDQLIREQIAGDLLEQPRINAHEGLNESIIGPMFYHLGEHRHGSSLAFNGIHQEMIDNKIDAFSKTFLAMTVACARCHDHKLDAISQADYYALAGVFMTPRWTARPIDSPEKHASQIEELKQLRSEIRQKLGQAWTSDRGALASAEALRTWAISRRDILESAAEHDVAWPLRQLTSQTTWLPTENIDVTCTNKSTKMTILPDGSALAGGPIPDTDSYTVTFRTPPGRVSVIRLEALTHDSLGTRGPGRTAHGNFVLSEIDVRVTQSSRPKTGASSAGTARRHSVTLSSATADYSQPNYPISSALKDVPGPGWGVGLGGNVDRTAKFYLAEPVDLPHGGQWSVRMDFHLGSQHVLGRFRLAVGGDAQTSDAETDTEYAGAVKTWTALREQWRRTRTARLRTNEQFEPLTDFTSAGLPRGWVADGTGMRHGYVSSATPRISLDGDRLVAEFLDAGYHTRALSPRLPGALRVPDIASLNGRRIAIRLRGGEWAGRRDIPQNAFLNEGPTFFDPKADPAWTTIAATGLSNGVTRVLTEITTADLNSNFPPRTGVANAGGVRLPDTDDGHDKLSWFSVTGLAGSTSAGTPADALDEFSSLYNNVDRPSSPTGASGTAEQPGHDIWQRLRDWLAGAVDRWSVGKSRPGDVKLLNWMLTSGIISSDRASLPAIATLVDRYRAVEKTISYPRSVNSMDERQVIPVDYRLNIRGDVYREADPIPRNFLEVFAGQHNVAETTGSGRLELARYLSDPENPQTARVYVNRVWQWLFGTGIVATPGDFGKLGGRPSHPELLDWLALQFVREGWSTKKLIRRLVLSRTFRQGSKVQQPAGERDPGNRLWHHYPTRRLEAEAIRDSLLAVSGALNRQLYGRPIRPPRAAEDAKKRLFSGPLDGNRRRSVYIEMSIMEPPKFLVGFNLPDLKLPTGRRDESNVPAQALILLNDPFVIQQAEFWAEQLVTDESRTPEDRIGRMFVQAFGRLPTPEELRRWAPAIRDFSEADDVMKDTNAWAELAHAIYNTREFIHYR